jgi:hypothetical protein
MRKKILSPWTQHLLPSGEQIQEPDNFGHCIWSQSLKKPKIYESKIKEVKD